MKSSRIAAATLALLGSAYAVAPGTAAASDTVVRPAATGCSAGLENGGPEARMGGVARCEAGRFRAVVRCKTTLVSSPILYYIDGPWVDGPGESWAYCFNYGLFIAFPVSAEVQHM